MKQLFDFQKVYLDSGQSTKLFFAASSDTFKLVDEKVCVRVERWAKIKCIPEIENSSVYTHAG